MAFLIANLNLPSLNKAYFFQSSSWGATYIWSRTAFHKCTLFIVAFSLWFQEKPKIQLYSFLLLVFNPEPVENMRRIRAIVSSCPGSRLQFILPVWVGFSWGFGFHPMHCCPCHIHAFAWRHHRTMVSRSDTGTGNSSFRILPLIPHSGLRGSSALALSFFLRWNLARQ